ncbi:hypothetical protein F5879DRAFT_385813 [Lentinula edodes]|nr:hypothetical protein HHX47_DHR3000231 [Lentinula edodes]KAJ3908231.1 hypothetical protein F5879DRAFT_385813 [Lentinula edodes]
MRLNFVHIVAALLATAASVHAAPLTAAGSTGSDLRIRGSDWIETENTRLVNVRFMSLSAGENFDSPRLHLCYETIEERVKTALANRFSVTLYNIRFKNDYKNDFALEPKGPSEILVLVTESNKKSLGTLLSINRNSVASEPRVPG